MFISTVTFHVSGGPNCDEQMGCLLLWKSEGIQRLETELADGSGITDATNEHYQSAARTPPSTRTLLFRSMS